MKIFQFVQQLANLITNQWLGLDSQSYFGSSLNFFIYDTIKIGLLLAVINYFMAVTRYYFPMEKVRDFLTRRRWFGLDYFFAAALGAITPFCSCSSIPLFIGFVGAGIPLGVTFTFLISSPLVNESSLYLFPALFGMKVTIFYNLIGMAVAILSGLLIQKLRVEKYVKTELLKFKSKIQVEKENGEKSLPFKELVKYFWHDSIIITKNVFPYVIAGVGIGALIHGFVPANIIEKYLSTRSWWAIPLATLSGLPLYANSVSVIPIMEALVKKGVPLGTALAFMTSIVTLSIPEALMLKKIMKWQLLAIFFGLTAMGIVLIGYLLNLFETTFLLK